MLGGGTIERVKGVIVWLAWLVFAGSNKSVTKIKQHGKTFFVKITCQYSDVCFFGFIESSLQTYMSHCSCNSFRILRSSVACAGANVRRKLWLFFRRRSQLADLRGRP